MVLMLSALLKLKSRQVDYTQAFPQAPLDDDVCMWIPQGWYFDLDTETIKPHTSDLQHRDTQHCIHLKWNLYGVKQAARNCI